MLIERLNDVNNGKSTTQVCNILADIATAGFGRPWEANDFMELIQMGCSYGLVDVEVDGSDEEITGGFAVYKEYDTAIRLVGFAIHPCFQKQGLGRLMLQGFIDEAESSHRDILVTATETDAVARKLLHSLGFEVFRIDQGTCDGIKENCYHLRYSCRYKRN